MLVGMRGAHEPKDLLKCVVTIMETLLSTSHRVPIAKKSAVTTTASHALCVDKTQTLIMPILRIGVWVAAETADLLLRVALGMIIEDVEAHAAHVKASETIASDVAIAVPKIAIEVALEVVKEPLATMTVNSFPSRRCT